MPTAPSEPEHRERHEAEPIGLSHEELAQQLAADPEFIAWHRAERMAELGAASSLAAIASPRKPEQSSAPEGEG